MYLCMSIFEKLFFFGFFFFFFFFLVQREFLAYDYSMGTKKSILFVGPKGCSFHGFF